MFKRTSWSEYKDVNKGKNSATSLSKTDSINVWEVGMDLKITVYKKILQFELHEKLRLFDKYGLYDKLSHLRSLNYLKSWGILKLNCLKSLNCHCYCMSHLNAQIMCNKLNCSKVWNVRMLEFLNKKVRHICEVVTVQQSLRRVKRLDRMKCLKNQKKFNFPIKFN